MDNWFFTQPDASGKVTAFNLDHIFRVDWKPDGSAVIQMWQRTVGDHFVSVAVGTVDGARIASKLSGNAVW